MTIIYTTPEYVPRSCNLTFQLDDLEYSDSNLASLHVPMSAICQAANRNRKLTPSDATHDLLGRRITRSLARPCERSQSAGDNFPAEGIRESILSFNLLALLWNFSEYRINSFDE